MAQYQRKLQKGIRWWYKFDYSGKTYFSKAVYLSKNEAKKAEHTRYEQISKEILNSSYSQDLSLLQAINERLDYVQIKKSSDHYKDNKRYYTILLNAFGDISLSFVKKSQIENLLLETSKQQQSKGKDNYAVNAMLSTYKALFNYVINKHELNIKNPCNGIGKFSVKKKLKYIPSDKDIDAVKAVCDAGQVQLLDFVRDTGCRISEALRLMGADIFEHEVILYTKKSINSDLIPRKLPKPTCINRVSIQTDERLFKRWSDEPRFLEDKVKSLKQRRWNWHNLRHRKASIWHNKEKRPLYEVMILLGHSNLKTTQGYLQLLP